MPERPGCCISGLGGYAIGRLAGSYFQNLQLPGALPVLGAVAVLGVAAVVASLVPAARAARVDVLQALQPE
jgi:ABC-type antimicrobial peptide transport system permease subunit